MKFTMAKIYKKHANPKFIYNFWDYNPKNHI